MLQMKLFFLPLFPKHIGKLCVFLKQVKEMFNIIGKTNSYINSINYVSNYF